MKENQKPLRQWFRFSLRALFVLVTVVVLGCGQREPLNAGDYQHLVGKSQADVRKELGGRPSLTSGFMSDEQGEREFETYEGMSIYYSEDGKVTSVESN